MSGTLTDEDGAAADNASVALSAGGTEAQTASPEGCDAATVLGTLYAAACTDEDGTFTLVDDIRCGEELTFTARHGDQQITFTTTLTCPTLDTNDDGDLSDEAVVYGTVSLDPETCGFEAGTPEAESCTSTIDELTELKKIAVVLGTDSHIQNTLAKLGYADTDTIGQIDYGETADDKTYAFDLYSEAEINYISYNNGQPVEYQSLSALLTNVNALKAYDILIINANIVGASGGVDDVDALVTDGLVQQNLQNFVSSGGVLYAIDESYDFIEQAFPSFFDFKGGDDPFDPLNTAETADAAEVGGGILSSDAAITDGGLQQWLRTASANAMSYDEAYNSFPQHCHSELPSADGSLNDDSTMTVGTVLVNTVAQGVGSDGSVAARGPYGAFGTPESPGEVPVALTAAYGAGRIFYTVFSGDDACPTVGFWPQERAIEYLLFEAE